MSPRSISWNAALRDLRDDRLPVAQPTGDWSPRPAIGPGGQALRDEAGEMVGFIVFGSGRCQAGVLYPEHLSTKATILPTTWDMSPVGIRLAKVAVEAALAAFLAAQTPLAQAA